jgi:hypothetical protein
VLIVKLVFSISGFVICIRDAGIEGVVVHAVCLLSMIPE